MGTQIGHSTEHVDVHEYKVVGRIEQLVLVTLAIKPPSCKGHQIEQQLQYEHDSVEWTTNKIINAIGVMLQRSTR